MAALAVAGVTVLVWRNSAHQRLPARHQAIGTNAARKRGTAPGKSATRKARKTAAPGTAGEQWHRGLQPWGISVQAGRPTIYYELTHSKVSCAKRARYGCWKVTVVARYGCRHGVSILIGETRHGADTGATAQAVSRRPLVPRKRGVVELDADARDVGGQVRSIFCETG